MKIKTPSDLKYMVEQMNSEPYFFTRKNMQFFGDTMHNYGIKTHENYYELYRKKPVNGGLKDSAFFDKQTFKRLHNI